MHPTKSLSPRPIRCMIAFFLLPRPNSIREKFEPLFCSPMQSSHQHAGNAKSIPHSRPTCVRKKKCSPSFFRLRAKEGETFLPLRVLTRMLKKKDCFSAFFGKVSGSSRKKIHRGLMGLRKFATNWFYFVSCMFLICWVARLIVLKAECVFSSRKKV